MILVVFIFVSNEWKLNLDLATGVTKGGLPAGCAWCAGSSVRCRTYAASRRRA
jgi:hypothetical protein